MGFKNRNLQEIIFLMMSLLLICLFDNKYIYCWYLLLLSFLLLWLSRKNVILFISTLLIAYSNYSIVVLRYFFPESLIINNSLQQYDLVSIKIMVFFMSFLIGFILLKNYRNENKTTSEKYIEDEFVLENSLFCDTGNSLIVAINIVALVLIWFFFFDFNIGEKAGYSPLYEYSIVFFLFGFYYSKNNKLGKRVLVALAIFYVLFDFLGGQRSTGVQILIVVAIMCFYKFLTVKRILALFGVGLLLLTMVGIFRGNFSLEDVSFVNIIDYLKKGAFGFSTAGFAYYTSLTFIGTMDFYSVFDRIVQFIQFLISQITVGTFGKPITALALEHFTHYYGGVLPIYFYYYLGWVGPVISAFIVSIYYNILRTVENKRSGFSMVVAIYVVVTTHRWYLYSPYQLLRGVFLVSLVYCAYYLLRLLYEEVSSLHVSMIVEKWDSLLFEMYNIIAESKWLIKDKRKFKHIVSRNIELKNINVGKRCFIVLNGPSIREHDLSLLQNDIVISTNYFYRSDVAEIVRPSFICWQDSSALISDEGNKIKQEINEKLPNAKLIFNIRGYKGTDNENIYYTYNRHMPSLFGISSNLCGNCSAFSTVAFYAINCAMFMGIKEIYILGLDFAPGGFKHFADLGVECDDPKQMNSKESVCAEHWSYSKAHFESFAINNYAKKMNCRIVNLNPNSYIRAFEFGNYEELFNEKK